LFAKHRGTYGSPRITAELRDEGWAVSENTVAGLMRELGLQARRKRPGKQTTRQGRGRWRAPNLIGRAFNTTRLNRKWYRDGTEIPTEEGKLYLDSVLDMGSRRIIGFAAGEQHDADLAEAALQMAVAVRRGRAAITGVIMHTDQGSEGGFDRSSQHLEDGGVLRWRNAGNRVPIEPDRIIYGRLSPMRLATSIIKGRPTVSRRSRNDRALLGRCSMVLQRRHGTVAALTDPTLLERVVLWGRTGRIGSGPAPHHARCLPALGAELPASGGALS
jgi:hypothetical protein